MSEKTEYIISLKDLFSKGIDNANAKATSLDNKVASLQGTIASLGLAVGFGAMAKGIFDAGTNMEGLNISLKTMLGSKGEADKLVAQMVNFASTTPFSQSEVQTAGKQLLAYGVEAKNIIPTLRQLGDVSAGLNQPIGEIAYLYGTIKTQGKAMTVDIRQFANRGIPIYEELAKVTGKSGEALQKYIEDGKVGFPQIQKAFENMSGAGGKFANLTAELAKSTGGQWSNTKDLLEQLAVDIFKELQPAINWFIGKMQTVISLAKDFLKFLREHKEIIKTVAVAVGAAALAYGTWTAAIKLGIWYNGLSTAAIITNTLVTEGWTAAQLALNIAMTANPVGIVIAAVAALAAGIYLVIENYEKLKAEYQTGIEKSITQATKDETKAVIDLARAYEKQGLSKNEAKKRAISVEQENTKKEVEEAQKKLNDARDAVKGKFGSDLRDANSLVTAAARGVTIATAKRTTLMDKNLFNKTDTVEALKGAKGAAGIDSAKSPEHKVITINIDKLIEKFTIATNTVSEGAQSIKEQIVKCLIEAVNDAQIISGV